jgi:hypothetical protein
MTSNQMEFYGLSYSPLQLRNKVLNRWLVSGILTRKMRFEPMTMEGDVNDWLIKGFSIHENPCRKEFVQQRRSSTPELPLFSAPAPGDPISQWDQSQEWNVYFPWGNTRVEESGFYFVPTHMRRYAYTAVVSPTAHKAVLKLKTCGGVALWVNGRLVIDFTPFTRNIEQSTHLEVELKAGENTLIICHEDLAERDTLYHFTLEYTGAESLEIRLPFSDTKDAEVVRAMETALEQAFLQKDSMTDEVVKLSFLKSFNHSITFDIAYSSFFGEKVAMRRVLEPGQHELVLCHTNDFGSEYKYFEITTFAGKTAIRKLFGMELYNTRFQPQDSSVLTVEQRKRIALECAAETGNLNIHTAIAKLKTGGDPEESRNLILQGLTGIQERRDCADFYLIALFRFWRDYRESGLFEDSFWAQIKETMLGFRYWIDEPGDDVMWFFSENHALLFHSCQLLAGQIFPEERFTNSGETGTERRRKAEAMLTAWFERFFAEGLAEWNSNAYIPIDVLGLVNLHDLAESASLRDQAKQALDLLYYYMANIAHNGFLAVTFGRSYEKELIGHHAAGTTSLLWTGYGVGNVNSTAFNVSLYLSDYEPPQQYADLQMLKPGEELVFQLEQGKDGYAKLYHYRTDKFGLSSIADFRKGAKGYQEHVIHLVFSPEVQIWVNHPGEIYPYGSGRPCFWAGNGYLPKVGQYRGLGILLFDIDQAHDAEFTHAYFPTYAFTKIERHGNWFFGEKNDAYAAIYAANGLELTSDGPNKGRELKSNGRRNIWILRASDKKESRSFSQFVDNMLEIQMENALDGLQVDLIDPVYGRICFSWQAPLTVNDEAVRVEGSGVRGRLERIGTR